MQPVKDIVQHLPVGAIIYHQPRNHYYRIMNKTMIKSDGEKSWEYGWSYVEVEMVGTLVDANFVWKTGAEVYSRPFSLFDSDWFLAY